MIQLTEEDWDSQESKDVAGNLAAIVFWTVPTTFQRRVARMERNYNSRIFRFFGALLHHLKTRGMGTIILLFFMVYLFFLFIAGLIIVFGLGSITSSLGIGREYGTIAGLILFYGSVLYIHLVESYNDFKMLWGTG